MVILSLPVEFWGHIYPHDEFEINYKNPKTKFWTYTTKSAFRGDKPYVKWIHDNFSPTMKPVSNEFKYVTLVKDVVLKDGIPVRIQFNILELNDDENWRLIDLNSERWQKDSAKIKMRGLIL